MIALDTNVLVRFVVADDPEQAARAKALVAKATAEGEKLFVSDLVLSEFVWVLESAYRFPRGTVVQTLERLLTASVLAFRDSAALARSVEAFSRGKGDFADYVILAHAREAGCDAVATFDRALLREGHFVRP
ncbi:MAG TPA: type II toxin-antitoxin system VapC family toxin [Anaeromyxobacter sp.]